MRALLTVLILLISAGPALAAETKSQLTMIIDEQGAVEVVDRWSGLKQEAGVFNYFSATREVGTLPVTVKNFGFTIAFKTRSYLRYEDGVYYFVTPDFYYEEGLLDVELSLTVPPNLVFLGAEPEPDYRGEGVLHWTLPDCSHRIVIARFERIGPFVQPGRTGPDFQVDPRTLVRISAEELPATADDVLKELENIIKVARASGSTDPDFIRVMDKLLAKFYYILDSNGLLLDYQLPKTEREQELEELAEGIMDDAGGLVSDGG